MKVITTWRGIHKLNEELGEVLQICGKLGAYPDSAHPDNAGPLAERLEDELADLSAAIQYIIENNNLNAEKIENRKELKLRRFNIWGLSGIAVIKE